MISAINWVKHYLEFIWGAYWPFRTSFEYIIALCMIGVFFGLVLKKKMGISSAIKSGFLSVYVLSIILSLIINRQKLNCYSYNLTLFHSYFDMFHYEQSWGSEFRVFQTLEGLGAILLNILLLFPIGVMAGREKRQQINKKEAIIIGVCLSLSIEILQLIFRKGIFELDDLFHNTFGFYIGWYISKKQCDQRKYCSKRLSKKDDSRRSNDL